MNLPSASPAKAATSFIRKPGLSSPAIIWDRKTILLRKYFSDLSRDLLRQLSAPSCGARQEKIFRS